MANQLMQPSPSIGSKGTEGQRIAQNLTVKWPNTSVITNSSVHKWGTTSTNRYSTKAEPVTSKYEIILQALSGRNNVNRSSGNKDDRTKNQKNLGKIDSLNNLVPLILPLALLGFFLAVVIICHIVDAVRTRRGKRPQRARARMQRGSNFEHAVEEVDHEGDIVLKKERQTKMFNKLQKQSGTTCQDIGRNKGAGRCLCKLEKCAHCLGFETKKLHWKDLVYQQDIPRFKTFCLKNASTQTWIPMHNRFRTLPQSSHKGCCISQRIPSEVDKHFVVEADSVFDSEVSSKPHFPSSDSNFTNSKKSDFLSSIRASIEDSKVSSRQHEKEWSKRREQQQKCLKKGDTQLLSDDWL